MKVLFDQCTPVPLRRFLHPHIVDTAGEKGWSRLRNGELLSQVESNHYDAFITTDTNLKYQQNLTNRTTQPQEGSRLPIRQFRLVMVGSGVVHNGHGKTIKS